nr:uncharacterized protein LOC127298315 [Lolium perenne]
MTSPSTNLHTQVAQAQGQEASSRQCQRRRKRARFLQHVSQHRRLMLKVGGADSRSHQLGANSRGVQRPRRQDQVQDAVTTDNYVSELSSPRTGGSQIWRLGLRRQELRRH